MSFDYSRALITVPRRSTSARRFHYPGNRDWEFDDYDDRESRIYDWMSTDWERAQLNRPRARSVPRSQLQDPDHQCERDPGWNIDYATAFLVDRLEKADSQNSKIAADILSKARAISYDMRDPYSLNLPRRGIVYQAFNAFDEFVFAGKLKDVVFLEFKGLDPRVSGATYIAGHHPNPRVTRVAIVLNSEKHREATPDQIFASLLHHMIHAYFLVTCGSRPCDPKDERRLKHSSHFGKIMYTIKNLSAASSSGRRALPIDFGHKLDSQPAFRLSHGYGYNRPRSPFEYDSRVSEQESPKVDRSYCPANIKVIEQSQIDSWYRKVCEPLLDLPECVRGRNFYTLNGDGEFKDLSRHPAESSKDFGGFIFDGKPVHVAADKIADFPSIKGVFLTKLWLQIPDGVDRTIFKAVYDFVHDHKYGPDITKVQTSDGRGPPLIKELHPESAPYLLTDIRVFKLACELKFEELKTLALKRLNEQHITHEDPIMVLKEVYSGPSEPHSDLQSWSRRFLIRNTGLAHPLASETPYETSNLWKLQNVPDLQPRFTALTDHGGVLVTVVTEAYDELLKMSQGPVQSWPAMLNGRYGVLPPSTYLPAVLHAHYPDNEWGVYPRQTMYGPQTRHGPRAVGPYRDLIDGPDFLPPAEFYEQGDGERFPSNDRERHLARKGWATGHSTKPQGWLRHNKFTEPTTWARDGRDAVEWLNQSPHERQGEWAYLL
ncbi:hypothetical protein AOQ84DRAFT_435021 [Glonium stellatum]|uniref:SprT-like domain-containing protein n=1 Tax=Glonium stellatum TaxID=574774 RepID=A0A8E2FFI9_9PEZI|nr:hypothetical protein AOQ84DRAFT_435021 [Glonium stellatum]